MPGIAPLAVPRRFQRLALREERPDTAVNTPSRPADSGGEAMDKHPGQRQRDN
jgi:hypothetical protein